MKEKYILTQSTWFLVANYVPLSEIFSKKILKFIWKILPPNSHFGTLDSRWRRSRRWSWVCVSSTGMTLTISTRLSRWKLSPRCVQTSKSCTSCTRIGEIYRRILKSRNKWEIYTRSFQVHLPAWNIPSMESCNLSRLVKGKIVFFHPDKSH